MLFKSWIFFLLAGLLPLVAVSSSLGQSGSKTKAIRPQPKLTNQSQLRPGTITSQTQATPAEQIQMTLTVEMDSNKLDLLRKTGKLQVAIPQAFRGRVDAVRLKRPVSFKSEDFQLNNAVDKFNNTVTVSFSDKTLDQLDYQPVKAKVYYSGFSNVLLIYKKRKPGDPLGSIERENKPTTADSTRVFARVDEERGLHGWMTGLAKIKLKSDFGEVIINSTDIAGIKLNANNSGSVSIRLHSGATVSGYVNFDEISMKCSWGTQKLSLSELDSIVADRKFRFAADPLHPGRWIFETELASQPPPLINFESTIPGYIAPTPINLTPHNP